MPKEILTSDSGNSAKRMATGSTPGSMVIVTKANSKTALSTVKVYKDSQMATSTKVSTLLVNPQDLDNTTGRMVAILRALLRGDLGAARASGKKDRAIVTSTKVNI